MGLSFVNRYSSGVSVCLLWYNRSCGEKPWRKSGWWNLGVGQGVQVLTGNLNSRYYYFYARAADGAYWGEHNRRILVTNNRFDICMTGILEPSYLVPLREIDTGQYTGFTVTLV
jgi:uncharacterized membrane protein